MRLRFRVRRLAKRLALAVCSLIALIWLLNGHYTVEARLSRGTHDCAVSAAYGFVELWWVQVKSQLFLWSPPGVGNYWSLTTRDGFRFDWRWPRVKIDQRSGLIRFPLWLPLAIALLPTAYLFWIDRRPRRCPACGGTLTGGARWRCRDCGEGFRRVRRVSHFRRTVKWAGLVASATFAVAWVAMPHFCWFIPGGAAVLWADSDSISVGLLKDAVVEARTPWGRFGTNPVFVPAQSTPAFFQRPAWLAASPGTPAVIHCEFAQFFRAPIWALLLAFLIPTAFFWYRDYRRNPRGFCQACGYDLTGNTSGRCPECGRGT